MAIGKAPILSAFGAVADVPFVWRRPDGPSAAIVVLGLILPLSSGHPDLRADPVRHGAPMF